MSHLKYMPGDPRLVDQLVYELKSKGIFDQFRKDCIADVDTKPAYQNLRQRVENSVSTFLSRQTWQPDLNKNQLREKLRKHILDGNYLEQGVERIVDQVVNPKVATVFIPKVEDLVYNYLGITRKKSPPTETTDEKTEDLLPTDLEAVSPGSVKSNDNKVVSMDVDSTESEDKMEIDKENSDAKEDSIVFETAENENTGDIQLPSNKQNDDFDKINIPLPSEEIKPETIPSPDTSPSKVELEKIELPKEAIISTDIPLPNDICKEEKDQYFKPLNSEDDDSSSGSSLRRNMSPLTPIRNFNNENSCDAQQAFENSTDKSEDKKEPSSFRFKIDAKSPDNSSDAIKSEKKETQIDLSYQFNNQVNINTFDTPLYEDSSNSNNLHIDYESDANSKVNVEIKAVENDQNSEDSKKEKKLEDKKSSHKSSHRSRDSHKHSSSKDKRSESKQSNSRDSGRHEKSKSAKDENKSKSSDKDKSKDKNEKKDSSRDSSRHRSSHKSSHRDSKSHRSSSSSGRHSSKHSDDKKSTSSSNHKDKSSSDKSKESKSSSHRSDKDRKSSSSSKSDKSSSKSKNDDKDKDKKNKKENDDHYSLSGRGNPNRRSTDRDSNDGSSSSKWSHNASSSKFSNSKKDSKSSSKSETTTSATGDSTSPSDKENIVCQYGNKTMETLQHKPIVRIESHLETPVASPPRLPFVPDVTIKKPKFAANFEEAKRLMKMRKFLDEEQKRMNQEAALLLEFQANVRPSMSQVYSSIPGPELEFACITGLGGHLPEMIVQSNENLSNVLTEDHVEEAHYTNNELLTVLNDEEENNDSGSEVNTSDVSKIRNTVNNVQKQLHCTKKIQEIDNHISESIVGNDSINVESVKNTKSDNSVEQNNESVEQDEFAHIIPITNDEMSINKDKIIDQPDFSHIPLINEQANLNVETTNQEQLDTKRSELFEVTIITEEVSENEEAENNENNTANTNIDIVEDEEDSKINGENKLFYFGEHEKYNAELERARYTDFFKEYNTKSLSNKIYLINGDTYEENLLRDLSKDFGNYEIVNYHRNGHLKVPKNKNVIKNVNISMEISLPVDADYENAKDDEQMLSHDVFSPGKSECSFELSNDYDAKLEEMVNKTSRQEIMEIILGNVIDSSPSKMPQIAYFTDSNIDREYENSLKRKMPDVETTVNNNRPVLTPNKIRKLSTEQISSTTPETEEIPNKVQTTRSKYLGKAKRVGLPRPRRSIVPNSPSSDKSVENYEQNPPTTPNGKVKRAQIQRYDTSDLYKPKLHYLSRRNHVT